MEEQRTEFRRAVASLQQSGQVLTPAESATLNAHVRYLIDKVEGFKGGKLERMTQRLGTSAAVHAL